jgi:pyruvate/2-oxoglutarate dehydrogenase complex dihydrolipoamide dehydrogenase (E3) component
MRQDHFDVVVIGGGSAAEALCDGLAGSGKGVVVVESDRVGGDCPFVACMPSKALLRSAAVRRLMQEVGRFGAGGTEPVEGSAPGLAKDAYRAAVRRRDVIADGGDDEEHLSQLVSGGVTVLRGRGVIAGAEPLTVVVEQQGETRHLFGTDLVIATGSGAAWPRIEGLHAAPTWTSEEALTACELPPRLAVLGGGAVGCELAQAFAGFGSTVTLIETASKLMAAEEPIASTALAAHLRRAGVDVRTSTEVVRVATAEDGVSLWFEGTGAITVDRIVVATGRRPSSDGLGLEVLGVAPGPSGEVEVDERCMVQAAAHVWACGDVTAIVPFTHGAKYQAGVVADNLRGRRREADYRAIPRVAYTDPPLAACGLTEKAARAAGRDVLTATMPIKQTARAVVDWTVLGDDGSGTIGDPADGCLVLVADRDREVLVGASAVGPAADEWISELSLAVLAEVPLARLRDLVHPFPTYCEAVDPPLGELLAALGS